MYSEKFKEFDDSKKITVVQLVALALTPYQLFNFLTASIIELKHSAN